MTVRTRLHLTALARLVLFLPILAFLPVGLAVGEPPENSTGLATAGPTIEAYRVGVEDVLEVLVWGDQTLSRSNLMVRPDGMITMPLLGDILAAGRTPGALAEEIEARLKDFLTTPTVTVGVMQINSYRVYILGKVNGPGVYLFKSPTRLLEAIVQAGGFTDFADESSVRIFTSTAGGQKMVEIDTKKITSGRKLEDNLMLSPGDMIYVP